MAKGVSDVSFAEELKAYQNPGVVKTLPAFYKEAVGRMDFPTDVKIPYENPIWASKRIFRQTLISNLPSRSDRYRETRISTRLASVSDASSDLQGDRC